MNTASDAIDPSSLRRDSFRKRLSPLQSHNTHFFPQKQPQHHPNSRRDYIPNPEIHLSITCHTRIPPLPQTHQKQYNRHTPHPTLLIKQKKQPPRTETLTKNKTMWN